MEKSYTKCADCRGKANLERYLAMPFQEWNELTPLTLYNDDTYFWNKEEVLYYCEEENIKPESLKLVICVPQYAPEIEADQYCEDFLPEDTSVDDIDSELAEAFEALNKVIRQKETPLSWCAGKHRTAIT
jgi:hypothetical protein